MHALLKHPLVDCDLEEAALWYQQRDPQVAEKLIDATRDAMRSAAANPFRFSKQFEDVRRVRLSKFPHSLYFQVRDEMVLILALVHGAQDTKKSSSAGSRPVSDLTKLETGARPDLPCGCPPASHFGYLVPK